MVSPSPSNSTHAIPAQPEEPSHGALISRLLALAWRYRLGSLAVLAQQVLLVAILMSSVGLTGLAIDMIRHEVDPASAPPRWPLSLEPPESFGPLAVTVVIAGLILLLAAAHAVLRYLAAMTAGRLVQQVVVDLRREVYEKLQRLSFRFFDANRTGAVINRVAGDVQAVRVFVDGVVIQVLTVLLSLPVYLGYMFHMHVPLTLACLATTPLLWWGAVAFSRSVRPQYRRASDLVDDMVLALAENVQGMQVVKGFAREANQIEHFKAANQAIQNQKRGIFWRVSLFQPIMGWLTQVNMIVLLAYGGWLVIRGELLLGQGLFVFVNLLHQFANQVGQITNVANSVQTALTGARRVFEVLDAPIEIRSAPNCIRLPRARGELRFERVSFGYQPNEMVLKDIDLSVPAGQCVAIVGATGAGKSTLLSLVPRFYDPSAGRVLVDGHEVRQVHLDDLRRSVGLVFQETFLFSNTVAANIAFGHPQASQQEIERAARLAAAHDFIMTLPRGYDTLVGEHGSNLSGGQRQRLALARALLLDPAILILDDATASVDPETEHDILMALGAAMRGRTTLMVAHRMSSLRRADRIIVIEHGRIQQAGSHAELIMHRGPYRDVAMSQVIEDESPVLAGRPGEVA